MLIFAIFHKNEIFSQLIFTFTTKHKPKPNRPMPLDHILIPVLAKLSTNCLCANRYRRIMGATIIKVPVESIWFERATDTEACDAPLPVWLRATSTPRLATIVERLVLTRVSLLKNSLE